ncbi:hypothetical protein [Ornithinimicrobium sp. Y1694]|uniref:hypothetical protein n=1 Tax=Ornithinimicrobium sp. Y1694 TaxID=3418590 RepID=UPI003CE9770D
MAERSSPREISEQQALALLRKYSRIQWVTTILSWGFAGTLMVLIRHFVFGDDWSYALAYSAWFTSFAVGAFLLLDWLRARRIPDGVLSWRSLERATIETREGNLVTFSGGRTRVSAPVRQAWHLREGENVWVGPRLAEGEDLVLIRAAVGPFSTPVHTSQEPARPA